MKRILLKQPVRGLNAGMASIDDDDALQKISDYVSELRLLKDVPFSYLIPDETLLPRESIRFFYLNENWLNALTDGALSIGRVAKLDAETDDRYLGVISRTATRQLAKPRFEKMHENHRRYNSPAPVTSKARTGLILRSELVNKWKGLEAFGYCEDKQLDILRMETLSSEILLCIFDGELTEFVISEPKTALRFGAPDNTRIITLRDVSDTEDFGKPLEGVTLDLNDFTEQNGRLRVTDLAKAVQGKISSPVSSPQHAFELIAVAKRAEFAKGGV